MMYMALATWFIFPILNSLNGVVALFFDAIMLLPVAFYAGYIGAPGLLSIIVFWLIAIVNIIVNSLSPSGDPLTIGMLNPHWEGPLEMATVAGTLFAFFNGVPLAMAFYVGTLRRKLKMR